MGYTSPKLAILQLKITQVKRGIVAKKKMLKCVNRSDNSKLVGGQCIRIRLKMAKKCGLYLDIFSCVKMKVFRSFFVFRLEMHIRCDDSTKLEQTGQIFWDSRCCLCARVSAF